MTREFWIIIFISFVSFLWGAFHQYRTNEDYKKLYETQRDLVDSFRKNAGNKIDGFCRIHFMMGFEEGYEFSNNEEFKDKEIFKKAWKSAEDLCGKGEK